jgi:uncharacterized alpha-E superfamily protein
MLSRIADSLFWLARYMERAEDTARILDVNYHMLLEQSESAYRVRWTPLISMTGEEERFHQFYQEANSQTVFDFLAFRSDNPNSIMQCISKARENARTIRDRISREMWEDINGLYHSVTAFSAAGALTGGPHRFCNTVKFGCHRFHGVTDATLPHDDGWQYLKIGWSLERAEMTARPVALQYQQLLEGPIQAGAPDNYQWMAVLKSVGAYENYRREYQSPIEPERVAEMLMLHAQHPRSVRFSMTELQAGLRAISGTEAGSYANEAERLTGKLLESLCYDTVEDIFRRGLHSYVGNILTKCHAIGADIERCYFCYGVVA